MNKEEAIVKLRDMFPARVIKITEGLWYRHDGSADSDYQVCIFRRDWESSMVGKCVYLAESRNSMERAVEQAMAEFLAWENEVMGRSCDNCGRKFFRMVDGNECQDMSCGPCENMDSWRKRTCEDCRYHKHDMCKSCVEMEMWD